MQELLALLEHVARSHDPVLFLGESGTGKELLARAVHARSPRAANRFIALNCAAISATTMEAELFGTASASHATTTPRRQALFEEADGGTLFLDEIGDVTGALQTTLARALEDRAFRRVGETRKRVVDVRIVAATQRDLPALVARGAFRKDLFHALSRHILRVPPLRERTGDLPFLVQHFLVGLGMSYEIAPAAMDALSAHSWPGNLRELRSVIERAALLAEQGEIVPALLPAHLTQSRGLELSELTYQDALKGLRVEGVRRYVEALLRRFDGDVIVAAEHAGVERESFYRLCRKHGVSPNDYRVDKRDGAPRAGSPQKSKA